MRRSARSSIVSCVCLVLAARAGAQPSPCGDLDAGSAAELDVRPEDRAEDVARNAAIVVRHPPGTDLDALLDELRASAGDACSREPICLFRDARAEGGAAREPVAGRVGRIDTRTLVFAPDARLAAETDHFALVAQVGFDRAARTELEFRTGTRLDRDPPRFDPAREEIRIAVGAPPQECGAPDGSVRVQLGVPGARDDGGDGSVELLLFVTSAAGLGAPELRARSANTRERDVVLTFLLSAEEAARRVCVALRAIDAAGRSSQGEPTLCFDPGQRSEFEPLCSAPAARGADGRAGSLVFWSAWLVVALRRRRRSRPLAHRGAPE